MTLPEHGDLGWDTPLNNAVQAISADAAAAKADALAARNDAAYAKQAVDTVGIDDLASALSDAETAADTATTNASVATGAASSAQSYATQASTARSAAEDARDAAEAARTDLLSQKGAASGVAPLDSGSRVPQGNLPAHLDPTALTASIDERVPVASTSAAGKVELATTTEASAGTDTDRAVTPAGVKAAVVQPRIASLQAAAVGSRLARGQSALANAARQPVDIVIPGDSIAEGAWAGYDTRWIDQLRDILRARYPSGAVGGGGYYPIRNIGGWATSKWTTAGSGSIDVNQGLGNRGVALTDTSTTVSATFTGTSVDVFYTGTPGSGTLEITIDGSVVASVATADPATGSGHKWSSSALTAGSHTISLRSSGGGWVWPEGAHFYNGDETKGVRVWDASHFGYQTADFNNNTGWTGALATVDPDLVILGTGRNGWATGTSKATFKTQMQALHDLVALKAPSASIAFLIPHETDETSAIVPWSDYVDAYYELGETNDCAVIDMAGRFPAPATAQAAPLSLLHSDLIHPLVKGHSWYARAIADALSA